MYKICRTGGGKLGQLTSDQLVKAKLLRSLLLCMPLLLRLSSLNLQRISLGSIRVETTESQSRNPSFGFAN